MRTDPKNQKGDQRKQLGNRGEQEAEKYLTARGYKILAHNYRFGRGELDLVCHQGRELVIVEVKSVRGHVYENGIERLSRRQQRTLIRTAYIYLATAVPFKPDSVRFDIILVDYSRYPVKIHHYPAAFWEH